MTRVLYYYSPIAIKRYYSNNIIFGKGKGTILAEKRIGVKGKVIFLAPAYSINTSTYIIVYRIRHVPVGIIHATIKKIFIGDKTGVDIETFKIEYGRVHYTGVGRQVDRQVGRRLVVGHCNNRHDIMILCAVGMRVNIASIVW